VVKLSQHSTSPSAQHYHAAMWVLAYLNQTKSYHLKFDGSSNEGIIAYSDSDWAGDKES